MYLSLGSNLGDQAANLREAICRLSHLPGVRVVAESGLYRTEPQNLKEQPWFFNQVIELSVSQEWTPHGLLAAAKQIEDEMGRAKAIRFGPRLIDIDILLFGEEKVDTPELAIPHPRMAERAFVLIPLADIASSLVLPGGLSVREALQKISFRLTNGEIWQD